MRKLVSASEQSTSAAQTFQIVLFLLSATRPQMEVSEFQKPSTASISNPTTKFPNSDFNMCESYCLWSGHSHETQARSLPPKPKQNIKAKCKLQQEPDYLHVSTEHTPGFAATQRRLPLHNAFWRVLTLFGWYPHPTVLPGICDTLLNARCHNPSSPLHSRTSDCYRFLGNVSVFN